MKYFFSLLCLYSTTLLLSCTDVSSSSTDLPVTDSTAAAQPPPPDIHTYESLSVDLPVVDEENIRHHLTIHQDDVVISFASWCPHSSNLLTAMSKDTYSGLFDADKIIFILDPDEIDKYKELIEKSDEFTEEQLANADKRLDEIKEYSKVADPSCFEKLSKFRYYYANLSKFSSRGFPSSFNISTQTFDASPIYRLQYVYEGKSSALFASFLRYFKTLENQ